MSTKRQPLLSDDDINDPKLVIPLGAKMIRDIYEAARAKDAELIQELLDALVPPMVSLDAPLEMMVKAKGAIELAASAGFKPTEP